jgi:hygromycin-B 4-O-kinase
LIVDISNVEAFLASRGGSDIMPVGKGVWSKAFAYQQDGGDFIIRLGKHYEDFAKDWLAAGFSSPALPIPSILEIGEAFGGYYAISERVFGGYLDEMNETQMRTLLPSLFAMLDGMRLADLSGTMGYGGWGADGKAPHPSWRAALLDVANDQQANRTHGWRERLAASAVGTGPFEQAYEQLVSLIEYVPEERHLIHNDLLHYNVLVEKERVSGVLDWGCGMYGDYLYDLAWFCFWQPWYPSWQVIDFRAEAAQHYASIGLEVHHIEQRLRCYQIHIGLESQAYQAFAGNWDDLKKTARRTLDIATSCTSSSGP